MSATLTASTGHQHQAAAAGTPRARLGQAPAEAPVTALAGLLTEQDRQRLAGRLRELRQLEHLIRQPGTLASSSEPEPLHRAAKTRTGSG